MSPRSIAASENGCLVDGLSTQEPVLGFNASPLSVEFLQDIEVRDACERRVHTQARL
jgi:hypothetical protein